MSRVNSPVYEESLLGGKTVSKILYISIMSLIAVSYLEPSNYGIMCAYRNEPLYLISKNNQSHLKLNPSEFSTIPNIAQGSELYNKSSNSDQSFNRLSINVHENIIRTRIGQRKARAFHLASDANSNNTTNNSNQDYTISSASLNLSTQPNQYQNDQPQILEQCCACDEAKYELVFEGLWSRYTHPDDFPENYWLARFSDIIGASHSNEFRMWNQNSLATEGVKELAETGSTRKLEAELKQVSSKTRTIIKARELHHPTLNSKTSAVFRTDRHHHLVSILSKLSPSPDWMVGVSGLELCQSDCSWATQRIVNLYLWDAGTDSGTTFTSPDKPTRPQERIRPFKKVSSSGVVANSNKSIGDQQILDASYGATYEDLSSSAERYQRRPFEQQQGANNYQSGDSSQLGSAYSGSGGETPSSVSVSEQTKPFARLTITRQRIYEKSCNGETVLPAYRHPPYPITNQDSWLEPTRVTYSDCRYTDWSDWASCSSTCGKGIRTRTRGFLNEPANLVGCSQVDLIEKEVCLSECIGNTTCVTQDWSEWSKCSVDCGHGFRKRTRKPIGSSKRACESVELVETEPCIGTQTGNCTSDPVGPNCEVTDWSQWSDCSVACGKGTRIRTRQYVRKESIESCNVKLIQKHSCTGRPELCKQNNEGQTAVQQKPNPDLPVIDCKLSSWGPWSTCSALCGRGKRVQSRYIIQMPQNGGKPCDRKLSRKQNCKDLPPCPHNSSSQIAHVHSQANSGKRNQTNTRGNKQQISGAKNQQNNEYWRATTSSTTPGSSMMDDEDDMDDKLISKLQNQPCEYGNWSSWSDCEVVCQPVKKGSNKIRQKHPLNDRTGCQVVEELYYCDPDIYC